MKSDAEKVAAVAALADEWERKAGPGTPAASRYTQIVTVEFAVNKIRQALEDPDAALAAVRAEARAEALREAELLASKRIQTAIARALTAAADSIRDEQVRILNDEPYPLHPKGSVEARNWSFGMSNAVRMLQSPEVSDAITSKAATTDD